MAKIVKLPVGLELETSSASKMASAIKEVQKAVSGSVSKEVSDQFKDALKQVNEFEQSLKKVAGTELTLKEYNKISDQLIGFTKNLDTLFKLTSKGLDIKINSKELEDASRKVSELEAKLESSSEKQVNLGARYGTAGSRKLSGQEGIKEDLLKSFPESAGSLKGMDIQSISKNIVHLDTMTKKVKEAIAEYNKLNKISDKDKSANEKARYKILNDEIKTLRTLDVIVDNNNNKIEQGTELYKKQHKETEKLREELEKARDVQAQISEKVGATSPVTKASSDMSDIRDSARGSKASQSMRFSAERNKETEEEGPIKDTLTSAAMDDLIKKFFSWKMAIDLAKRALQETITIIGDLDKAFVNIAVVTQYSNKEVWGMYNNFKRIGQESGFMVSEIGKVAGEYFRQGESYSNVLLLTEAAAKAAKVAGIDAAESVDYLTSAVRGYNLAATDAMMVSDKFAAIAAGTATSYEGMATAFSKVAAQAYASNVEFDSLMGMMATAMEVTQEAPENIGTAFKTIFARMAEIKDFGATLEDGVDSNRIETSLKTVGVQLFDTTGEMRALDDVLLEVGAKWKGLTQTQKAYLATTLAGSRQQTRLLAVFENYDKTLKNIDISANSLGATEAQQLKNAESMEHALNNLNVAYEGIVTTVTSNTAIISGINMIAGSIESLGMFLDTLPGKIIGITALGSGIWTIGKSLTEVAKKSDSIAIVVEQFKKLKSIISLKDAKNTILSEFEGVKIKNSIKGMKNFVFRVKESDIALKGAQASATGFGTALKASLGSIAVFAGVAAVLVGVGLALHKANNEAARVKKLSDAISKLNSEIYNLEQTSSNLESLVDEYKAIEVQVSKTNEQLARQKEILTLLNDLDISGNYTFDINGKLDSASIERFVESQKEQLEEATTEKTQKGLGYASAKKPLKDSERRAGGEAAAMQMFGSSDFYSSLAKRQFEVAQENGNGMFAAEAWLKDGLNLEIDLDKWDALSDTFKTIASTIAETDLDIYRNALVDSNFDSTALTNQIQLIADTKDTLDLTNVSAMEYAETMRSVSGDFYGALLETDAFLQTAENWKHLTNTTVDELSKMDNAFAAAEKHSIELSDNIKKSLVDSFDEGGYKAFFEGLTTELRKSNASIVDTINYTKELIDIFDKMPEDMLLNQLQSFDSMEDRLRSFNDAMDNFNTASLRELLDLTRQYPEHAEAMIDSLEKTGQISETVQKNILEDTKERMKTELENEITQNEARIEILKAKKKVIESLAKDEVLLNEMASSTNLDISNLTAETIISHVDTMGKAYEHHFNNIIEMSESASLAYRQIMTEEGVQVGMVSYRGGEGFEGELDTDGIQARLKAIQRAYSDGISSIDSEIQGLTDTNKALGLALGAINDNAWNKSAKEMEKAGKAAKKTADSFELYTGALNKMYAAEQRLSAVNFGMDLIKSKRGYEESADAVRGLAGAKEELSDSNFGQTMEEEYGMLDIYSEQLKNIIDVTGQYHNNLEKKLNPSLKGTYQVIAGKVIPISDRYKRLTGEQMKELDEFAKSFNGLTDDLQGYQKELYETEKAQNDLLSSMRDTVIEYQELLIDAIKNEEKKQLDSFKKIIDANKKYIAERKKLYEQSFEDEDNDKEAQSIQEQRQAVIEKLAALEAAHDITSAQRKLEYRQQLQELDDQYNLLMLERNREALLESLDNQSEYQDDLYTKEEEAYNRRVESGEWLEERLKQIQDRARLQALMDLYLHDISLQKMLEQGYITQEDLTRMGIENTNTTVGELTDEQLAIFTESALATEGLIDKMWGKAEKDGIKGLSKKAMDNILEYLKTHSTQMEEKTSLMKDKVTDEWKGMMKKVNEYTKNFNAITLKSPNTTGVTNGMSNVLSSIKSSTKGINLEYDRLVAKANSAAAAMESAARRMLNAQKGISAPKEENKETFKQIHYSEYGDGRQYQFKSSKGTVYTIEDSGRGMTLNGKKTTVSDIRKLLGNSSPFATGGTTERTGFHWLDGETGKPERVLSPGQNMAFEAMLKDLSEESKSRVSGGGNEMTEEVVKAIYELIDATYQTETDIKPLVDAMRSSSKGISLDSVISNRGISVNRSGGSK